MMDMDVAPRKKKEEVLKVPRELGVVESMKEDDLKTYMFPHYHEEPWYYERCLSMELDAAFHMDDPFPYVGTPFDPAHRRRHEVAKKLADSIWNEFMRSKYCKKTNSHEIKPGEAVDLKSLLFPYEEDYLLRRKGRGKIKAKNLKGKYILVCCSYAPLVYGSSLWKLVYACSEMYSKLKGNFEMVVVTKMRHGWTHPRAKEKDAFRQFFSAFPSPCLAVPIHARSRRHHIFKSLDARAVVDPKILMVGPDGHALLHKYLSPERLFDLVPINLVGSDLTPFPFLSRNCSPSHPSPKSSWIVNSPSNLKRILSPSSEFLFRKIFFSKGGTSDEHFVKEEVSLSDLSSKPVALYLYSTGEKLPLLRHVVQGCEQTNRDLEVVVVYLPICQRSSSFPEIFSRVLALRGLSWWVAPHNFSTSVVLKRMFSFLGDRVIMIGPNEQCVEVRGLQLMEIYGIYGYPFTFDSVVQKTVEELKQVTLESFKKLLQIQLPEYPCTAKNVLFYFDCPYDICPCVYDQVFRFHKYKEVVIHFISLADNEGYGWHVKPGECNPIDLPWHTKGVKEAGDFFLRFFNHKFPTIVAFGEDGKICSLVAHNNLSPPDHLELEGNLCEEVSSILEKYLTDYDKLEYDNEGWNHEVEYLQELRQSKFW